MKILAYSSSHDGAAVLIENGSLTYSLENEKDSGERYSTIRPPLFLRSAAFLEAPDVVALEQRAKPGSLFILDRFRDNESILQGLIDSRYIPEGPHEKDDSEVLFSGHRIRQFSSSHVRSHIMCTYGLSPFPQGQPCYVLIWEGVIGAFYYVDEDVEIRKIGDVLAAPGNKYMLLYGLADSKLLLSDRRWWFRLEDAGKLMALAAYGNDAPPTPDQQALIDSILSLDLFQLFCADETPKSRFSSSRFFNIGVESQEFKDLARRLSEALFNRFYHFARNNLPQKLPLLIAGGCGLNCDWNSQWLSTGLFTDVFVPPCANDSGIALGAAIDALHHYTGRAKISWSVYAGDPFVEDVTHSPDFDSSELDLSDVCQRLLNGEVIAWVQGRYEMGPRALGNRSLLAAPFDTKTRDKLNRIKQREKFRPIAPICLEEDFSLHFENDGPSPYMLRFQRVRTTSLQAITHVDGSARAQSVNDAANPEICALLREFRHQSGVAVLCNTSLNFKGHGFINRLSHLFLLAHDHGIDGLVVGTRFWRPCGRVVSRDR